MVAALSVAVIVAAVYVSKRRGIAVGEEDNTERVAKPSDPVAAS